MTLFLRRSLLAVVGLISAASCFPACSTAKPPEAGATATSGVDAAAIGLETSDLYVQITNNAGRPLERVRITIHVVGNSPPFTTTISRMENGEIHVRDVAKKQRSYIRGHSEFFRASCRRSVAGWLHSRGRSTFRRTPFERRPFESR